MGRERYTKKLDTTHWQATLRVRIFLALLILGTIGTSGCLFRSHRVESRLSNAPLKEATQQQLIDIVNKAAAQITTLNATVDIDTSVGGQKKGKVTEYQEIRGYILAEKPAMLRMIGLFPIVRNRAFDMVSNGHDFKLSIPPKNQFIIGTNQITKPSPNALENLRPQAFSDALLMRPIDPENEIAVLEGGMQNVVDPKTHRLAEQPNYRLDVIRRDGKGNWFLSRKIYFDRTDMTPYRQLIFDREGNVATDATYQAVKDFNGIPFPTYIDIVRPQEEYKVGLTIVELKLNVPLKPAQFDLQQPPGAQVKILNGSK